MTPRIDALRQQLQQLQALHDRGDLGPDAHAAARQPLERELVDAVTQAPPAAMPSTPAPVAAPGPSRKLQAGLALAVLGLAVAGYGVTGSPGSAGLAAAGAGGSAVAAAAAASAADNGEPPVTEAQVIEIVERMAQRLKDQPGDGAGWALLARAYSALGRHAEAAAAFDKAVALTPDVATLLVDHADSLAAQNGGQFTPQALKLIERALVLEPGNIKALALAGSAAYDRRDYAGAVALWERVERGLPAADSGILPQVRASIAQARELGGLGAAAAVPSVPSAPVVPGGAVEGAGAASAVAGRVALAPALAGRAGPEDTVFILARPAEGSRMPLAVLRKQVKDLPLSFRLDDSMAMAPGTIISKQARVVVSARISKSGEAMPRPGDLSGQSAPVAPGATGIEISIDEVVRVPGP